ncbi:hypothetical protein ALC62_03324 [Cyphomyrmex costatus]|uniref:Helix-turn-helix domain-containing protein n=1 Tax=Cyphomyrmex costatus TaxID=456900 RepID=A0A151ILH5_9HYME|nr:hypothetical protein ALC62_03324 [Cyphomyrmex costatus]
MVDRAFLLSVPKFHKKNLIFVIETLLDNDYPVDFVFNIINERLKSLLLKKTSKQDVDLNKVVEEKKEKKIWFTIPFMSDIANKFKNAVQDLDVNLSFFSLNKLSCFIHTHKDHLPNMHKRNLVYKINCNDCRGCCAPIRGCCVPIRGCCAPIRGCCAPIEESENNNCNKKRCLDEQNLENKRSKRCVYKENSGTNRGKKRSQYAADLENNRAKKRMRYSRNSQHERDRQNLYCDRTWLYNKRYYEKNKSKSNLLKENRNTAKNIIRKYEKFRSKNYIKYNNPAAIENIFNKLDIKNHVEKRLEAERIVRRCTQIRDSYVRDMYKILALLKKKSEVCLSLATKCKTIDEKLCAFCGKSKHTASFENYFIDDTYRNIPSSQILVMNMEG